MTTAPPPSEPRGPAGGPAPDQRTPSPENVFRSITAFHLSQVLKGAIELDLFTAIGEGNSAVKELAERVHASERGVRILCDYLTVTGFLHKALGRYRLTAESAAFLDRRQPAYLGGSIEFLLAPQMTEAFGDIAGAVRKGGTMLGAEGTVSPDNPIWVEFARAMQPMAVAMAQLLPGLVTLDPERPTRLLDLAASHGLYGLTFARQYPRLEVVAVDWPNVLEVGRENAGRMGALDRWHPLPGSAFDVDFGTGFDLALVSNFFHHFDEATNEGLMRKIHGALVEQGRVITVEFIPNEERTEPPGSVTFAMIMLASTAHGDAYPFSAYRRMLTNAGFRRNELVQPPTAFQQVIISHK